MKSLVPARLVLQNGAVFRGGCPVEQEKTCFGEVVFPTGMMGYVESLTDPSFAGQILVFTYPLIGNYGVPEAAFWESNRIQVKGVVVSQLTEYNHHYQAVQTLSQWLKKQNIPLITGVDTRALTKALRVDGAPLGAITSEDKLPTSFIDPNLDNLVGQVSINKVQESGSGPKTIIAVDCGMKENILRCLSAFPMKIKRVPYDYDYSNETFDGVFISNGPGDPATCKVTIEILKKALKKKKPVFGICLGAQLLSLSIGAKTFKLPFGHRGQNQPCERIDDGRCFLTSQNHGYAIAADTLPSDWKVSFRNLNDGSVEGIEHTKLPFFAVQFHPESAPGPTDTLYLFEKFYRML